MALGSLYGGICLGPVNTAAVHALAYPLGSEYGIAHGISIAALLPHVVQFNATASPERHARVALALGASPADDDLAMAHAGIQQIWSLFDECHIPDSLEELGISQDAIPHMAEKALTVKRLLQNNLRALPYQDAIGIYTRAFFARRAVFK
jgi:alcohol dehydrogenase